MGGWDVSDKSEYGGSVIVASIDREHSCQITLHGATIISWRQNNDEKLYLSPSAIFDGVRPIRGGVPLVFPQFSRPNVAMAQHGFLRNSKWSYVGSELSSEQACVHFKLSSSEVNSEVWPFAFSAMFSVTINANSLHYGLQVTNLDCKPFDCHMLLHSYIRVPDINDVGVVGLKGRSYIDKVNMNSRYEESSEVLLIDKEIDRMYQADGTNAAEDIGLVRIASGKAIIKSKAIAKRSSIDTNQSKSDETSSANHLLLACEEIPCDIVVWNAWVDRCRAIEDLDDLAYQHYVCLEPGLVSDYQVVSPNECVELSQMLTVE